MIFFIPLLEIIYNLINLKYVWIIKKARYKYNIEIMYVEILRIFFNFFYPKCRKEYIDDI